MGVDTAGGTILTPPQATVFVGGSLWAVITTPISPHGPPPHAGATMVKASLTVFVQSMPACRTSDVASCGCPAAPGFPTVLAGG